MRISHLFLNSMARRKRMEVYSFKGKRNAGEKSSRYNMAQSLKGMINFSKGNSFIVITLLAEIIQCEEQGPILFKKLT